MSSPIIKLSICVATYNRSTLLAATLESIVPQLTSECEIIVSDDASTDDTERVVSGYAGRTERLRYFRQTTNVGLDRNFDRAVELANGEYCWLMSDDDLFKPDAVSTVLNAIRNDYSLVVTNRERRDANMMDVGLESPMHFSVDRIYPSNATSRLFADAHILLIYIGSVVIKRAVWVARERERFYGSLFIHIGVIFQDALPGETLLLAKPVIYYRLTNASMWWPQMFEVTQFKLPELVWSLDLPEPTKRRLCRPEPWRHFSVLLKYRVLGAYSLKEYEQLIRPRIRSIWQKLAPILVAHLPVALLHRISVFYYSLLGPKYESQRLLLRMSRDYERRKRVGQHCLPVD